MQHALKNITLHAMVQGMVWYGISHRITTHVTRKMAQKTNKTQHNSVQKMILEVRYFIKTTLKVHII